MKNKLRIIAGEWRSRQIVFEDSPGLRPTPARIRETLFNWLQHDIVSSHCLDLFAGTGALGFEAVSRGAKSAVMIEKNAQSCRLIKENTVKLSTNQIKINQTDVFKFLAGNSKPFNLVFLDPPFAQNLAQQTCHWLEDKGWLTVDAKMYVEVECQLELDEMPNNWKLLKSNRAGEVGYYLFGRDL